MRQEFKEGFQKHRILHSTPEFECQGCRDCALVEQITHSTTGRARPRAFSRVTLDAAILPVAGCFSAIEMLLAALAFFTLVFSAVTMMLHRRTMPQRM